MDNLRRTILILSSLLINIFSISAQITANDDVGYITICNPKSVIIPILDNDQYPCTDPDIKIVNYTRGLVIVDIVDNKLKYELTCSFREAMIDSVRYSVECAGEIDTATVYIHIDQTNFAAGLSFSNSFDKTCLNENEVITHTCIIRNNCATGDQALALGLHFYNEGVVTLHEGAQITTSGTVTDIEHSNELDMQVINFTLGPGSEIQVTTKYHITQIISGRYETTIAELMGVTFDSIVKLYIPICDRALTISSCDPVVPPVDVAIFCSSSPTYSIIQQPSLGTATIDANGIFRYTRPATIPSAQSNIVRYEVICGANSFYGQINLNLLPCMNEPHVGFGYNTLCRQDSCEYNGSPSVLINEVMIAPEEYNGAIYGRMCDASREVGGEWIELYNLNNCSAVDISGYILGNASTDAVLSGTACLPQRGLGAGFVLPQGTRIPPMGFCVIRSAGATPVESSRLVENGGNTVEIIIENNLGRLHLNNGGTRFWLPDEGGWIGLYDGSGIPQDAVYWEPSGADICADCSPGIISGINLSSLDGFPANRKTKVLNFAIDRLTQSENSVRRIADGGNWGINTFDQPTMGYCNGVCATRFSDTCNGTAAVTVTGGSGSYSYLWNDSHAQTTATATGLCEGTYCVTITDNGTLLKKIACVDVQDDSRCHRLILKSDEVDFGSCIETEILVDILKNDTFFVSPEQPEVRIVSAPLFPGATASIDDDNRLVYTFPEGSADFNDRVSYSVSINGMMRTSTVYIDYRRNVPVISNLKPIPFRERVIFNIQHGTGPFVNVLDNDPSTATFEKKFENVIEGWHTLLVTDRNFCTADTTFEMPPQCKVAPAEFFTPGEPENNVWTIANLDCYENYSLSIYDRFGKLLIRYVNNFTSWDGKYLGNPMPSTDYWYELWIDDIRESKAGHFTLIRR